MLVLHIGPHKTATTYLQGNFYRNRARLLERGWLYPLTGERVKIAHHDVSDYPDRILDGTSKFNAELERIGNRAKSEGLNVLLSSEGFRRWRPKHFQKIRALLRADDLHIVYTIRDPLSTFHSFWAQQVKNGSTISLPELFEQHFRDPLNSHLVNPVQEIEPLLGQPGIELTVLLFDEMRRRKLDIFTAFMEQVLQIHDVAPVSAETRNERLPIEMTEFIRAINPLAKLQPAKGKISIGTAVRLFLYPWEKKAVIKAMHESGALRTMTVSRDSLELGGIEERIIERLSPYLWPAPASGRIFSAEPGQWVHYDADALRQDPQVRRLMDKALKKTGHDSLWIRNANRCFGMAIALRRWKKRLRS
ncbi:hypothetical protein MRS76_05710 [Rhizobiaceae bacterium n13]|uniref:Sulfotransferase family protein n=1 Tax=Ferirhizobium litorale TaxID=2927786 RepID=A0AAE3QDX3_9HYPH|nr:hypothetical protein [Fererhizobium litorale]MDI7861444.1 hypothetical protein [Fererhizobium litorale]MDI7921591.1 hypothetical protein [Fererhizobium litorale]